jgi:hypothetical protein
VLCAHGLDGLRSRHQGQKPTVLTPASMSAISLPPMPRVCIFSLPIDADDISRELLACGSSDEWPNEGFVDRRDLRFPQSSRTGGRHPDLFVMVDERFPRRAYRQRCAVVRHVRAPLCSWGRP